MNQNQTDVLIVGAGLSGIGAAYRLQTELPGKSYAILEARANSGGTWDLFKYPGIRSDSDMFTLGYPFRPWTDAKAIADGGDPNAALWPRSAKAVSALRRVGLNALLTLGSREVATFFDTFFDLPVEAQRSYLSDRRDASATAKVMATLFRSSPWHVRKTLMRAPFLR